MIGFGSPDVRAQMLATVAIALINMVLMLLLARILGPVDYAVYGIAIAVGALALVLQDGGHRVQIFRELTRSSQAGVTPDAILGAATGWTLIATAAALLVGLAYGWTVNATTAAAIGVAVVTNVGKAYCAYASAAMRARNAFILEAKAQLRRTVIVAVALVGAVIVAPNPMAVLAAAMLGQFVALWSSADRKELRPPRWSGPIAAFMMIDVITMAYSKVDQFVLVSVAKDMGIVGSYLALTRIIDIYVFAMSPLAAIYFRYARANPARFAPRQFALLSALLGAPGAIALLIVLLSGESLLVAALGEGYRAAARYLPYVVLATLFLAPNFLAGQWLVSRNAEKQFLICVLVALVAKLLLSLILVPEYGPMGCILAVIATEITLMVALLISVGRL